MTAMDSNNDPLGTRKWLRDLDEYAKRLAEKDKEQRKATNEIHGKILAKMQAMQEIGDIDQQVRKRLQDGEWDKCRGLPREQQRKILKQIHDEELVLRMQQEVADRPTANWEEHRLRRIELIKWSELPETEKEKWLEFYNQTEMAINLNERENHAEQTQKHPGGHSPQSEAQQPKRKSEPESFVETVGPKN